MSGFHLGLAGLVDTGKDGSELYADVVGCATHQESWMKTEKKLNSNIDEGHNQTTYLIESQLFKNQGSGGRVGFQQKKSNAQYKLSG